MATADTLTVRCPSCGHTFSNVSQELWGKKARCACGHRFVLPAPPVGMSKRALYGAGALGLGLLVVVGSALALFYPKTTLSGVQSSVPSVASVLGVVPDQFDPTNFNRTKSWAKRESEKIQKARLGRNDFLAAEQVKTSFAGVGQYLNKPVRWEVPVEEVHTDSVVIKYYWIWPEEQAKAYERQQRNQGDQNLQARLAEAEKGYGLWIWFHQIQGLNQFTLPGSPPQTRDAADLPDRQCRIMAYNDSAKKHLRRLAVGGTVPIAAKINMITLQPESNAIIVDLLDCRIDP